MSVRQLVSHLRLTLMSSNGVRYMKVHELITRLAMYPSDMEVVMVDSNSLQFKLSKCDVGCDLLINYMDEDYVCKGIDYFGDEQVVVVYPSD